MYAVFRDDKVYLIRPLKREALEEAAIFRMCGSSKHKWSVRAVTVNI